MLNENFLSELIKHVSALSYSGSVIKAVLTIIPNYSVAGLTPDTNTEDMGISKLFHSVWDFLLDLYGLMSFFHWSLWIFFHFTVNWFVKRILWVKLFDFSTEKLSSDVWGLVLEKSLKLLTQLDVFLTICLLLKRLFRLLSGHCHDIQIYVALI